MINILVFIFLCFLTLVLYNIDRNLAIIAKAVVEKCQVSKGEEG